MADTTIYNKKDVYETSIAPLVQEIKKICMNNQIPFLFSAAVANTEKKTSYCNEGLSGGSLDVKLTNNCISKYFAVLGGGTFVLPSRIAEGSGEDYISDGFPGESSDDVVDEMFIEDLKDLDYK